MKFISKFLSAAAICLLPIAASAQFVQPPTTKSAFAGYSIPGSGTNVFTVAASATTNLLNASTNGVPAQWAQAITVGPGGFGVTVYATAAGTSLATNTLAFEYTGDGVNWVTQQPLIAIFVTNNIASAQTYYTNIPNTALNVGNLAAIRLKYITNSAAQITYWTNIMITTR